MLVCAKVTKHVLNFTSNSLSVVMLAITVLSGQIHFTRTTEVLWRLRSPIEGRVT